MKQVYLSDSSLKTFLEQRAQRSLDYEASDELIDQAIQLAHHQKVLYLELRAGTNAVIGKRSDLVGTNLCVRWLLWGVTMESIPYYYYPQMSGLATTSESNWKYRMLTSLLLARQGAWPLFPARLPVPLPVK